MKEEKRKFSEYKKALKEQDRKNLEQSLLNQKAITPNIEEKDPYYKVKITKTREVVNCDGTIAEVTRIDKKQKPTCKLTILNTPDSTRQYWIVYDRYNSAYPVNEPIDIVSDEKVKVVYLQKDAEGTYTVGSHLVAPFNNPKPRTINPDGFTTKSFKDQSSCLAYLMKLID